MASLEIVDNAIRKLIEEMNGLISLRMDQIYHLIRYDQEETK
jgi:hypothetical protein